MPDFLSIQIANSDFPCHKKRTKLIPTAAVLAIPKFAVMRDSGALRPTHTYSHIGSDCLILWAFLFCRLASFLQAH